MLPPKAAVGWQNFQRKLALVNEMLVKVVTEWRPATPQPERCWPVWHAKTPLVLAIAGL
jgi:hypothetical protein